MNKEIQKEADVLLKFLKAGRIDTNRLADFLSRVAKLNGPVSRKETKERFFNQLVRMKQNSN